MVGRRQSRRPLLHVARQRRTLSSWFAALAAFDVIANNADRKAGHVIFDETRCWAIDNGLCFNEIDKLRTVVWEYAGLEVEPGTSRARRTIRTWTTGADLAQYLSPE
jgi:hypothetical protein